MSRGADIGMGEDYVGENNTRQCILLLKYPHSPFLWITVWKQNTKIALDTSNLGTEVGRTLFVVLDIVASIE